IAFRRLGEVFPGGSITMTLSAAEHARRLAAYKATKTDREAASLLGLNTESAFQWWRLSEGLPVSRDRTPEQIATQTAESRRLGGLKAHMRSLVRKFGIEAVRAAALEA